MMKDELLCRKWKWNFLDVKKIFSGYQWLSCKYSYIFGMTPIFFCKLVWEVVLIQRLHFFFLWGLSILFFNWFVQLSSFFYNVGGALWNRNICFRYQNRSCILPFFVHTNPTTKQVCVSAMYLVYKVLGWCQQIVWITFDAYVNEDEACHAHIILPSYTVVHAHATLSFTCI